MIGKLIILGLEEVSEFHIVGALNPKIIVDGELFLAKLYGNQKLFLVKKRSMDNSDGSEWIHPYQTKTAVYYLDDDFEWIHYEDL